MTDRMWLILEHLNAFDDHVSRTPNQIGYAIGVEPRGGAQYRSRGPGSIIARQLTSLRTRGLVWFGSRDDGLSGTAYHITDVGRAYLKKHGR